MEETKNYIKNYYSQQEHNFKSLVENIDLTDEEMMSDIKREISKLQKQIELKRVSLQTLVDKSYSKQYIPTSKKILLKYMCRSGNQYYYDIVSGVEEENTDNSTIYHLDTKIGTIKVVVGYDYDLASIIVKEYDYRISKDNDRITLKFIKEYVIPFMEDNNIIEYNAIDNTINETTDNWGVLKVLEKIKDNEFINTLYGIDYKGELSLRDLRRRNLANKSFEIILKTAPTNIVDMLLNKENITQSCPIHKILGVSQETYNMALERNMIEDLINNLDLIKGEKLKDKVNKTEKEWLDFIEEIKTFEEDMRFYNIDYASGYYYGGYYNNNHKESLVNTLLKSYYNEEVLQENYSLGKFCNYVINETINQGYDRVRDFASNLTDYLEMCKCDNIVPTLYSSYLKQTHDITSRNHKVKVEQEQEEIFASRYKDFKTYNGKNYMVVAPKNTTDLKIEGDRLNHCVASYIKRVIDNECLILFLRKNKDESLITMEIRHNTICQVRGLHNRKPNNSEIQAIREFAKYRKLETNF